MINNPYLFGGGSLDPLDNPASASDILAGKEAYSDSGAKLTGTMVDPTPTKGLVFENYDADGYPTSCRFVGFTGIPSAYCYYLFWSASSIAGKITEITIPDGVTSLGADAFHQCTKIKKIFMPNNGIRVGASAFHSCTSLESIEFMKNATFDVNSNFSGCTNLTTVIFGGHTILAPRIFENCTKINLYDFSHCTSVPSLYSVASLGHASGCVIKVPQALLAEWQAATNWVDLANVEWQGV